MYRILMRLQVPERQPVSELRDRFDRMYGLDADRLLPHLGEVGAGVSIVESLTLQWLGVVEPYVAATAGGLPVTALRYEDLTRRPLAVLGTVFERCDLPGRRRAGRAGGLREGLPGRHARRAGERRRGALAAERRAGGADRCDPGAAPGDQGAVDGLAAHPRSGLTRGLHRVMPSRIGAPLAGSRPTSAGSPAATRSTVLTSIVVSSRERRWAQGGGEARRLVQDREQP